MFSNAAIQFCLSIKVLFRLPLWQAAGMVARLLQMAGLDWPVPGHSTLCRRQKSLTVQIPYRRAEGPLNLLVDSSAWPSARVRSAWTIRPLRFSISVCPIKQSIAPAPGDFL